MAATIELQTTLPSPDESAITLSTVVELVRRIMHADVASIVRFSLIDKTITWMAASGLRAHTVDADHQLIRPITNELAARAIASNSTLVLEGIGVRPELPASDFPVHAAEGIQDLAFTPLKARGEVIGALVSAYRQPHKFSDEEKHVLEALAELAAIALDNARLLKSVAEAENVWKQTFNAIAEGMLVYDDEQRITHCNLRAAEMLEMELVEVIGLSFREAFSRMFGQRAADYYLGGNYGASTVVEVQSEYGRRFLVSISPIRRADGKLTGVVTWNDVTQLSEVQDQLGRSRRLASVGQLAAGVAHEVNNPLAAITTCAEAVMRDIQTTETARELADSRQWNYYLEEIVRQSLRCKEITRGLLDLTRQRQANRILCDVNEIVKQCAKVGLQRAGSSVEFNIILDADLGEVATDAGMLRQLLDNLLANAIDALAGKRGQITVSTKRHRDRIAIAIADTGQGISPEVLSRIFDPFFSTKGPGKGYGLGLAICLALAESLGGGITVETKEEVGSTFRVWIPRRAPD